MKILPHKYDLKKLDLVINNNLEFIARNIIYPEPHSPDQEKDVSLKKIMTHLGGTYGEINYLSYIYKKKNQKNAKNKQTSSL